MSYSLNDFCEDARAILATDDDHDGRNVIRQKLEQLLREPGFCDEYVGPDAEPGMRQIHEDPDYGFCILTYNMGQSRTSPPHDHGRSWAVYGQAAGYTDMTVWSATDADGRVEPSRHFRLNPGDAGLFDVRDIHSIEYAAGAKFVRVTGVDMSTESRRVFDPESGTMREVESVGTGNTGR